jgi:hypothetical protein
MHRPIEFWSGNPKGGDHLGDLAVDDSIEVR